MRWIKGTKSQISAKISAQKNRYYVLNQEYVRRKVF